MIPVWIVGAGVAVAWFIVFRLPSDGPRGKALLVALFGTAVLIFLFRNGGHGLMGGN